jgi:NADPH:quinone reductase-like Zn-dependent oxidoreductase
MPRASFYFADYLDGPLTPAKQSQGHGYGINGVLGDYILLEDTGIAPMPAGMSYEEAATLPTAALTAWMATVGNNNVPRGGTVLVEGTGGIALFALQMRSLNAHDRWVRTTASTTKTSPLGVIECWS